MALLVLGLVLFLGVHSVRIFASAWRERMIARLGEKRWRGVYTLVSFAGLAAIVWGYGQARMQPTILYVPPVWGRHLVPLLLLPIFVLFASANLPGRIKGAVKHPMLTAVGLWGLSHLLANGTLADVLLFGGFAAWAILDRISVARRPAPAVAAGSAKNDVVAVVSGLAIYAVTVFFLHEWLIGVSPLPM